MFTGWHFLDDNYDGPVLSASTFLDVAGAAAGMKSPERLCRPYFKGRPDPREVATKARAWAIQGCRIQVANEPNLPMEGFGGGPDDFAEWFEDVARLAPTARLYWPGMSPGVPGWEQWYTGRCAEVIKQYASGVVVHAYGTAREFLSALGVAVSAQLGKPLWVGECNPGAGRPFDRDAWARDELPKILDYCRAAKVEAFCYFAYRWPTPDMALPTPVDAAGTEIERVINEWKEPTAVIRGIDVSNNQGYINWPSVAASGVAFAAIKASGDETDSGRFVDTFFPDNWREAGELGLVRIAYHYAVPSKVGPAQSVSLLQEQIEKVGGLQIGDMVALDLEDPAVPSGQSLAAWTGEWLALAEKVFGHAPLLYTGNYYMAEHDLYHESLGRYPLWLASWQADPPPVPSGWPKVTIWQYSSSGRTPGVVGDCDLNRFEGTVAELRALGRQGSSEPIPEPTPDRVAVALADVEAAVARLRQAIKEAA